MYQFGEVKETNDPEELGRVKVSVYGFHDNIKTLDLAWSNVLMPTNTPAQIGLGHSVKLKEEVLWKTGDLIPEDLQPTSPAPEFKLITEVAEEYTFDAPANVPRTGDVKTQGSLVCGTFLDPASQEFLVIGTLPTKTAGVKDNNVRLVGTNPHADEPTGTYEPQSAFKPIYPYNNVYETASGHAKEYDDTLGYERIMERHMSGTQYEIQPNGSKIERIVRDNYQLVVGHDTLEVFGNVRIVVSGQADIAVANDVNLAVGGNLTADITGNMTANITGTTSLIGVDDIKIDVTGSGKKITLDGDVDVTGDLRLTAEGITLNTHTHGQNNVNQPNTAGPNAN